MLGFEFCIDTRDTKAVCYRQPTYGVHEANIMSDHISQIETNSWIRDCAEPWGILFLLATKTKQESCVDIDKFV